MWGMVGITRNFKIYFLISTALKLSFIFKNALTLKHLHSSHLCQNKLQLKKIILFLLILSSFKTNAQKIENIYANLYTDSLKKGTHNYINIDGEMSNGKYLPLDSTKIIFTCADADFFGNSLFIPADFKAEKVLVRATLRSDITKFKELILYIKKLEDPPLKSEKEVLAEMKDKKKKKAYTKKAQ